MQVQAIDVNVFWYVLLIWLHHIYRIVDSNQIYSTRDNKSIHGPKIKTKLIFRRIIHYMETFEYIVESVVIWSLDKSKRKRTPITD